MMAGMMTRANLNYLWADKEMRKTTASQMKKSYQDLRH